MLTREGGAAKERRASTAYENASVPAQTKYERFALRTDRSLLVGAPRQSTWRKQVLGLLTAVHAVVRALNEDGNAARWMTLRGWMEEVERSQSRSQSRR